MERRHGRGGGSGGEFGWGGDGESGTREVVFGGGVWLEQGGCGDGRGVVKIRFDREREEELLEVFEREGVVMWWSVDRIGVGSGAGREHGYASGAGSYRWVSIDMSQAESRAESGSFASTLMFRRTFSRGGGRWFSCPGREREA